MAKKEKIVINNQELTPTVLFVKQDKKKSSFFGFLWIVLIFGVFIGCVCFMPQISSYVKQYINPDTTINYSGTTTSDDTKKDVQEKEVITYDFSSSLSIEIDKIIVTNFKVENSTLSFDIKPKNNESSSLDNHNYYMTLYSSNNEVLQIIKIKSGLVKENDGIHQSYNLNNSGIAKLTFIEIKKDEYPVHQVGTDGNGVLTCESSNNTLKYHFRNNKLYASEFTETVSKSQSNYASKIESYDSLFSTYANATGITTERIDNTDSTTFKITVDLSKNDGRQIVNIIPYSNGTEAKIVYFEVNASGYTCK